MPKKRAPTGKDKPQSESFDLAEIERVFQHGMDEYTLLSLRAGLLQFSNANKKYIDTPSDENYRLLLTLLKEFRALAKTTGDMAIRLNSKHLLSVFARLHVEPARAGDDRGFASDVEAAIAELEMLLGHMNPEALRQITETGCPPQGPDKKAAAFASLGLSRSAVRIRDYLKDKEAMPTYDEISNALQMGRGTISKALKELKAK